MGFTAIWITPVTEQLSQDTGDGEAYHGYWQQEMLVALPAQREHKTDQATQIQRQHKLWHCCRSSGPLGSPTQSRHVSHGRRGCKPHGMRSLLEYQDLLTDLDHRDMMELVTLLTTVFSTPSILLLTSIRIVRLVITQIRQTWRTAGSEILPSPFLIWTRLFLQFRLSGTTG
jgi:hypothetical protein